MLVFERAYVVKIIDGDTLDISIDLGFHVSFAHRFRLRAVNAPEIRGVDKEAGLRSKQALETLLPIGQQITLWSYKSDKYGRYLCQIIKNGDNINERMIAMGVLTKISNDLVS